MKITNNLALAAFTVVALAFTSLIDARPILNLNNNMRLVLQYQDQQFTGRSVLNLRRKLRQQFPGIRLRNLTVQRVRLLAKSRRGQGTAKLIIGGFESRNKTIDGNRRGFFNSSRSTFDSVRFRLPNSFMPSGRPWRIKLRGNIIVRRVVMQLKTSFTAGPSPFVIFQSAGVAAFSKFRETRVVFPVNQSNVGMLQLIGVKRPVYVNRAIAVLRNGRRVPLVEFEGRIDRREVRSFRFRFNRRNIQVKRVIIVGSSIRLIGSRGRLNLMVGTIP